MGMVVLPLLTPELLEQMTEAIVQAVAPEQIVLFGSRATGLNRPDSDIDFLIVEAEPFGLDRSRRREATKVWKALGPFGIPADVLVFSTEEVAWIHWMSHQIGQGRSRWSAVYMLLRLAR
jgi:hypothetical protein